MAVLADVHANLHAFEAALRAVQTERPDQIVLLGDLVGYNAFPNECVALAADACDCVVRGNHDQDALCTSEAEGTNHAARRALEWTRERLTGSTRRFLGELPLRQDLGGGALAVHGCFISQTPYSGYVTSTMLEANLSALELRGAGTLGLCGHTHCPMLAHRFGGSDVEQRPREQAHWPSGAAAVLVNPGSIGQPRDRDPRLAFALVDTERRTVTVRRLDYDVAGAAAAIVSAGLPVALAERLKEGR